MTQGGDGLGVVDYTHASPLLRVYRRAGRGHTGNSCAGASGTVRRIAALVAHWQAGFRSYEYRRMLLCGGTVDYGPCAFMDEFDGDAVFSAIDTQGRYRYANQDRALEYECFASCLLPILHENQDQSVAIAQTVVDEFPRWYTGPIGHD